MFISRFHFDISFPTLFPGLVIVPYSMLSFKKRFFLSNKWKFSACFFLCKYYFVSSNRHVKKNLDDEDLERYLELPPFLSDLSPFLCLWHAI